LSIAACLGAGLYGVDRKIEPPAEATGDASVDAKLAPLPRTLKDAVEAFETSKPVREVIGDAFVDHWSRTRKHEIAKHERAVSDWELARYFEII
jgi:glutamine synthetase